MELQLRYVNLELFPNSPLQEVLPVQAIWYIRSLNKIDFIFFQGFATRYRSSQWGIQQKESGKSWVRWT